MSFEAFLDFNKTCLISAEDAFYKFGKEKYRYFCPNKKCSAKMILKSYDGEKKHFFASIPSFPHVKNCVFSMTEFRKEDFNEADFSLVNIFNKIAHINAKSKKSKNNNNQNNNKNNSCEIVLKTIKTLNQLVSMCLTYDVTDEYNGIKIWRMLLDERSENFYKNGIYAGVRLIKCIYHRYDSSQNKIYLKSCGDYDIAIHIKTDELYSKIKGIMYESRQKNQKYIIFGNWENQGKYMVSEINSEKQYMMLV